MEYRVRIQFAAAAVVIAIGVVTSLVTSTVVAARAYKERGEQSARQSQTITVKGSTRQRIRSDRAVWRIDVRGDGRSMQNAYAVLEDSVQRVSEFLNEMGIRESNTALGPIGTTMHYARDSRGNRTSEVASYTLNRTFTVATADVERVAESAGQVTQLIQDGVFVVSRTPEYVFTQLAPLKIDLMAVASADARARAEKIAESAGCSLGELRDARMGVLQITAPDSTEVAGYGLYDTSTIDKDVRAVVTATFGVRKS